MKLILLSWKIILLFKYYQNIIVIAQIQGVLCLGCFLRRWKNKRVSRKPCKGRSDLVLKGQMRVPKNKQCYFENHVVREPCKRRTVCTFKINKRVRHIEICIVICSLFLYSVFIFTSVYTAKTLLCCSKLGAQSILAEFQTLNLIMIKKS